MYFGSVRFFRHLILAILVLLILIPTTLAVIFAIKYHNTYEKLVQVEQIVTEYSQKNDSELENNLVKRLNSTLNDQIPIFQQQVDATVGQQVGSMKTEIDSAIDSRLDEMEQSLRDSTDAAVAEARQQMEKNLTKQMNSLRQELSGMIGQDNTELEAQMNAKLDLMSDNMTQMFNQTLSDQVAVLLQQLEDVKSAFNGNK